MRPGLFFVIMAISAANVHLYSQTVDVSNEKFNLELDYYIEDVIVAQKENVILGFTDSYYDELRFKKSIEREFKDYFKNHLSYRYDK
jgi:hypothetical protein